MMSWPFTRLRNTFHTFLLLQLRIGNIFKLDLKDLISVFKGFVKPQGEANFIWSSTFAWPNTKQEFHYASLGQVSGLKSKLNSLRGTWTLPFTVHWLWLRKLFLINHLFSSAHTHTALSQDFKSQWNNFVIEQHLSYLDQALPINFKRTSISFECCKSHAFFEQVSLFFKGKLDLSVPAA